jgi:type II secretory pathway pseudopilin PulG
MTESHDPWEAARERQREEVKAIFAARAGGAVEDRRREFRLSRRNNGLVVLAVLALLIAAGLIIPNWRHSAADQRAAERAAQAELAAAERARVTRLQKPRFASGPHRRPGESVLAHRARLVEAAAALITADARKRMAAGDISGPVAGTECVPFPINETRRAEERDPSIPRNSYECLAFERRFELSDLNGKARTGLIGQRYWLVIDYAPAKLAYCLLVPPPGEGGKALSFVRVDPACTDPRRS